MTTRILIAMLLLLPLSVSFDAQSRSRKSADKNAEKEAEKEPLVTAKNYDTVREHVLPSDEEEKWRKMEWRTTFWQGVMDAQKADKPVLLFAMNGHPFGCT